MLDAITSILVPTLIFAGGFAAYMLPGFVAGFRNHHQQNAILMLNLLFGWSVIGWGLAMIWACTASRNPKPNWREIERREAAARKTDITPNDS